MSNLEEAADWDQYKERVDASDLSPEMKEALGEYIEANEKIDAAEVGGNEKIDIAEAEILRILAEELKQTAQNLNKAATYLDTTAANLEKAANVLASTTEKIKSIGLPPLKKDASGILCSKEDGIDRRDPDFMREKLQAVIDSGEIYEDGWKVVSSVYSVYGAGGHTDLEIIKPDGTMFASLDTQQIDRATGELKGYFSFADDTPLFNGGLSAPVIDECKPGNKIVLPKNKEGGIRIFKGEGTEAMRRFAKAVEANVALAKKNLDYEIWPDQGKGEACSNTFARASVEAAAGGDLYAKMRISADDVGIGRSPGLNVDLIEEGWKSRYDGMTGEEFINNPAMVKIFCDDMKELHPISQQIRALNFGTDSTPDTTPLGASAVAVKP